MMRRVGDEFAIHVPAGVAVNSSVQVPREASAEGFVVAIPIDLEISRDPPCWRVRLYFKASLTTGCESVSPIRCI